ncbi:MAG TPA: helix-turn-helix transcriptional regulator [Gaiellaceae bacterium]|jgi:transcriptional regulator with XRE-family HTH domain|nr:helix-turn-helix transcriptional regulator [Gaiellaceae bacterium]
MTTGELIRSARLRADLSQKDLAQRLGMASSSIARWETDTVEPGYSTLRRVLQACGFDIPPVLVAYQRDPERDAQVQELQKLSGEQRVARLLARLDEQR